MAFGAYTELSVPFPSSSPQTFTSPSVSGSDTHGVLGIVQSSEGPMVLGTPTWNGVSMTLKSTVTDFDIFGSDLKVYELDAPAAGATTISFSWTGGSSYTVAMAVYHTGVTALRTAATATGTGANPSVSVTTVSGDEVLGMVAFTSTTEPTAGTGMTLRGAVNTSDGYAAGTGTEAASSSSHTVDFAHAAASWGLWGCAWEPAGGAATWGMLLAFHNNRLVH